MRTLVCLHCGRQVLKNKKLKHLKQQYCSDTACQTARKLHFERKKYQTNSLYRSEKLLRARERKKALTDQGNPLASSLYQRDYRASNPDYVIKNRQQQHARNARKADKAMVETKIVNPDALMHQKPDNETVYAMIAVDYKKIVNPDALMPQIIDAKVFMKEKPMFVRLL